MHSRRLWGVSCLIRYDLHNVTLSNNVSSVEKGSSYSTTLTIASEATADSISISVTMGGIDVTSNVLSENTITIPNVTGDVNITASAYIEETISWGGSGVYRDSSVIDATNNEVYYVLPFVEDTGLLVATATPDSNALAMRTALYLDEEKTQFAGYYQSDVDAIEASGRATRGADSKLKFGTRTKIAPLGYYAVIQSGNNQDAFNSNGNYQTYLNTYGKTVQLV